MAFLIFLMNAVGTLFLLMLGGFPRTPGLWFLLLNVVALLLFVYAPDPAPLWRTLLFCFVVPIELASIYADAKICAALRMQCLL
jgi:hypothetical protein